MINDLYIIEGETFKLVKENNPASCDGCYFLKPDEDGYHERCLFKDSEERILECGSLSGIYKKINSEKGVKKKLNLN
jgi:hypothetical protein